MHLATIWLAAIGTVLSAYFILAANSFMQHPVGYEFNPATNRAEMTDFGQLLFQNTTLVTFGHVITSCFLASGAFVAGVSAYLLLKGKSTDMARSTMKLGMITTVVAFLLVGWTGDSQAVLMFKQQPMKMASAEALYETSAPAPFSIFTIGTLDGSEPLFSIDIPTACRCWQPTPQRRGARDQQPAGAIPADLRPGDYKPNIPVAYWGFRIMIGLGGLAFLFAIYALWATRKGRMPKGKWFWWAAIAMPFAAIFGISAGWIFTEMGRQPWVVFGLMQTQSGVSPGISTGQVITTVTVFTLLYAILAIIEIGLMIRAIKIGPPEEVAADPYDIDSDAKQLSVTYQATAQRPGKRIMELTTVWIILIAVLWSGYFVLEGFDFGVGMLLPIVAKDEAERRAVITTLGPVWDGNEVWLLVAEGHLRGVPGVVRHAVQRLLPAAVPHPHRPDRPGRRLRVPQQALVDEVAKELGHRDRGRLVHPLAAVGRGLRQHRPRRAAHPQPGRRHPV